MNGLDASPAAGEDGPAFGQKTIARLTRLEQNRTLKLIPGFGQTELDGLKIFLRTGGENSTGNCVACHTPPNFTDHSFHNKGISQREYDKLHGEGKFAGLIIPDASTTVRPSSQFREIPSPSNPALVDLGHWNFVDLRTDFKPLSAFLDSLNEDLRRGY
ncbi:MAG: hypothetical protein IPG76_14545 [Acidobacteria bacterium]|nr:hypothetical protein [Acidobacteriota bacterium]